MARSRAAEHAYRRRVLDRLLPERIAWTPRREDGIYEYRDRLHFDHVLTGIALTERRAKSNRSLKGTKVTEGGTSPTGFEPVFWP